MDAYPYFQNTMANSITQGKTLFNEALAATQAAVGSKPVWITETGFPVSGKTENQAVPGTDNAKTYYDQVGCPNFGTVNTWWFTLQDSNGGTPNPSFGLIGSSYSTNPLYDLSCADVSSSSSAASSKTSSSAPTGSVSASASATSSAVSSLSSAANSGSIASSGSGLSPSEGAGNGVGSGTLTSVTSTPTGSTNGNESVSHSGTTTTPSATTTDPSTVGTNAANALSGSFAGAVGAIMVAVVAL
jgi:glucan endo-1,3-beta-D-glucosidase